MKKTIFSVISVVLFTFLFCGCSTTNASLLKINWDISIPSPDKIEIFYNNDGFGDASEAELWTFNDKTVEELINTGYFTEITEENIDYFSELSEDFYYHCMTDDEQIIYDSQIRKYMKPSIGNYFLRREQNLINSVISDTLILYLDTKSNTVIYLLNDF